MLYFVDNMSILICTFFFLMIFVNIKLFRKLNRNHVTKNNYNFKKIYICIFFFDSNSILYNVLCK